MNRSSCCSRRTILKKAAACLGGSLLPANFSLPALPAKSAPFRAKISAHMWVYASTYPPPFDGTPELERAFRDLYLAGYDGIELMEVILRHDDSVERLNRLMKQYDLPVTGCSYGAALWDASQHAEQLADVGLVVGRLRQINGKTLGISVGDAKRIKTAPELDAQAEILKKIVVICDSAGIVANLHNHTYEVENGMHDLKGTLARIPEMKLGPDLNWLVRAGVNPVSFIETYGHQIVYLHIRDQYHDGQWTEYVGQGVTDFPAIAAALRSVDFRGSAAIELAFPAHYVPKMQLSEDWRRSRDYVKRVFGW